MEDFIVLQTSILLLQTLNLNQQSIPIFSMLLPHIYQFFFMRLCNLFNLDLHLLDHDFITFILLILVILLGIYLG